MQFPKNMYFKKVDTDSHMPAKPLQSWRKSLTLFSSGHENLKCTGKFPSGGRMIRSLDASDGVCSLLEWLCLSPAERLTFQAVQHEMWSRCMALNVIGLAVHVQITGKTVSNKWCTREACSSRWSTSRVTWTEALAYFCYSLSCQTCCQLKEHSQHISRWENKVIVEMKCGLYLRLINLCV